MHGIGPSVVLFVSLALLIGAITRWILQRTRLPYSAVLVVLGLLTGIIGEAMFEHAAHEVIEPVAAIDPHLLLLIFLPALIFESAFSLDVHLFKRILPQILVLAIPGLLIAAALTASLVMFAVPFEWSWPIAITFGVLISATDPVAVVALLKEVGASKRLGTLIEGESLLNDGTAIVFFGLLFMVATSENSHFGLAEFSGEVAKEFVWVVSMGLLAGFVLAKLSLGLLARTYDDALIEITVTIAASYLSFYVAEHVLHGSGVVAVVILALFYSKNIRTHFSPEVLGFLKKFWGLVAYLANSVIFLIVGLIIAVRVPLDRPKYWGALAIVYFGTTAIRAGTVAVLYQWLKKIGIGITREKAYVLVWGGLRGAVALALALVLVQSEAIDAEVRQQLLFLSAGMVLLTILVNGSSMRVLLQAIGLDTPSDARLSARARAQQILTFELHGIARNLRDQQQFSGASWSTIQESLDRRQDQPKVNSESDGISERRRILEQEKASYWKQFDQGGLSRESVHFLSEELDLILDGEPTIGPRSALVDHWRLPSWIQQVRKIPGTGKWYEKRAIEHMANEYAIVRSFLQAQNQNLELLEHLQLDAYQTKEIRAEILQNKKIGFSQLLAIQESFPEIQEHVETHSALQYMLLQERQLIDRLLRTGSLDKSDAQHLQDDLTRRLKKLYMQRDHYTVEKRDVRLASVLSLHGISETVGDAIQAVCEPVIFEPKDRIIEEGATDRSMYIVLRGAVEIIVAALGETPVDILGPGSIIGEMSLLLGEPRSASVVASLPTEVLRVDAHTVQALENEHPEFEAWLWKLGAERWFFNHADQSTDLKNRSKSDRKEMIAQARHYNHSSGVIFTTQGCSALLKGAVQAEQGTIEGPAILAKGTYKATSDCYICTL